MTIFVVVWFDIYIYIFVRADLKFFNMVSFVFRFFLFEYEIIMIVCLYVMWGEYMQMWGDKL